MTATGTLRLYVETHADELLARGMFAEYVADGRLTVEMRYESSGVIGAAEAVLLMKPADFVAIVLNCPDNPELFRKPVDRILLRDAPQERWHAAIAVPNMTTWVLKDSTFAATLSPSQHSASKIEIARLLDIWANQPGNQIDRAEASRQDAAFAALNRFIEAHIPTLTAA